MRLTYSDSMRAMVGLQTSRQKVERLEGELLARGAQTDCPVENIFPPGVYIRKMIIPAGVTLTGAEHKTRHVNIVARGRIAVETDLGLKEFGAGDVFISPPGTKRAGFAIEETVWITAHPNPADETDMQTLVETLTTAKYSDLIEVRNAALSAAKQKEIEG
jgi:hypothetical protein